MERIAPFFILSSIIFTGLTAEPERSPYLFEEREMKEDNKAEELFRAGLFSQSIPYFVEMLAETHLREDQDYQPLQLKLAQAYAATGQLDKAIDLLEKSDGMDSLYFLAECYKENKEYVKAQGILKSYLEKAQAVDPEGYEKAQFEYALLLFLNHQNTEAKESLSQFFPKNKNLQHLKKIYIARILMQEGHYKEAESTLSEITTLLYPDEGLRYEVAYLLGLSQFENRNYSSAIDSLSKSLPVQSANKCLWFADTQYHLGWAHLKLAEAMNGSKEHYDAGETAFKEYLEVHPDDKGKLALGQLYLYKGKSLHDSAALKSAETILSNTFKNKGSQSRALLLRAEAAPSFEERKALFVKLTQTSPDDAQGWYLRGKNDYDQGLMQKEISSSSYLDSAGQCFQKSLECADGKDSSQTALALKYLALTKGNAGKQEQLRESLKLLERLLTGPQEIIGSLEQPNEIQYLYGYFSYKLAEQEKTKEAYQKAEDSLVNAISGNGEYAEQSLKLLGIMLYRQDKFGQAERVFLDFAARFPSSPQVGEAVYWAACCVEGTPELARKRKQEVYEKHPESPFAPIAYFSIYTPQEYLQGEKAPSKHLQQFVAKYPNSPLTIEAYYYMGLDSKRDRKTSEGKWIKKRNLTSAIDAFQNAETAYKEAVAAGTIPNEELGYYSLVRQRSVLERALANLSIAEESQGAKRQIYLEYAEEVFKNLIHELESQTPNGSFSPIIEETYFGLAQTHIKANRNLEAQKLLDFMIGIYQKYGVDKGYYVARSWYEKAKIAYKNGDFKSAADAFRNSDYAGKGGAISTDQKLDTWIWQSECCRAVGAHDEAILILSNVVNDNAISSLRLKAMFMRAEIYEEQKRPEIARKQLESLSKKGGPWGIKAKEKLVKEYGY